MAEIRKCSVCGELFPATTEFFHKNPMGKNGLRHECKDCYKLFSVWNAMVGRCHNPQNSAYKHYGARGISVCESWRNSFDEFREWAISNGYAKGLSVDRTNNDGDYTAENCRWTTTHVQLANRRILRPTTSRYRGVHFDRDRKKWVASISLYGKTINLGRYSTEEEAAEAHDNYITKNNLSEYLPSCVK